VGPFPEDVDLLTERLSENPARWYLTGFIAPVEDESKAAGEAAQDALALEDEGDPEPGEPVERDPELGTGRAEDEGEPDPSPARSRLLPNSLGLTILLPEDVSAIGVSLTWGDYVTEPPVEEALLVTGDITGPKVEWRRLRREARMTLQVPDGRGPRVIVPESAAPQMPRGALVLEAHARAYTILQPDGTRQRLRALTVALVNRRSAIGRSYADVAYAFQVRMELHCPTGISPRWDLSGHDSKDEDRRLADLHYRDVAEYAVGLNTSAGWTLDADGRVRSVHTDPMPLAQVERVEPNEHIGDVEWGMEALASRAAEGADALHAILLDLPKSYAAWIATQSAEIVGLDSTRRQETAEKLVHAMRKAEGRIAEGIALLHKDDRARLAFRAMNEAVARAARQRNAGPGGDPASERPPAWRPFQLAFVLLNLAGLADKQHSDREIVDLLFFPTGGGKTEAYLGLAAWTIAHRRLSNSGKLGAGVAVLMRYTLRLLTLDQLSRAAGVICALELMRSEPAWQEGAKRLLGDWPIEIGLWVGSAASPNRLGGKGNTGPGTAVTKVLQFRATGREAPAPLKACPWCGTPFGKESFRCVPNHVAPRNMVITCVNAACVFTGDRPLPVLTVDEAIYRRLPAFLISTVDKFAGLPWLAQAGAFFGHVDRADDWGFYGAADKSSDGQRLWNGAVLDPPDLIVQDELHLISGPLGTIAALYETALDKLATRTFAGQRIRPKIVASTATVRRANQQIQALFDRKRTEVFPPPGLDRRNSFFALTRRPDERPARWYVGLAAQGKGPKLVFLRALTTLLAASELERHSDEAAADPFLTALCYFNALRELGGARRIVEDEVRARLATYGTRRRRLDPGDTPFADRSMRQPLELTSRVTTDEVAKAKQQLDQPCSNAEGVDVALATNMISVGLDIARLGLMLVQGQPKTAAEYIQATSRVGRQADKPGLVLAVLNVHKPRDRMHYEQFRHFHACFYRAVEATSVTPWSARALDRALAAVVVSIARHLDPSLTPEAAARSLKDHPETRDAVSRTILERAPTDAVVGGHAALTEAIDRLLDGWLQVAEAQTANGGAFNYAWPTDKALLHDPLDPGVPNLPAEHKRFVAGRSMRDVEATVTLKMRDPRGSPLVDS
jgi:hypothetical protein